MSEDLSELSDLIRPLASPFRPAVCEDCCSHVCSDELILRVHPRTADCCEGHRLLVLKAGETVIIIKVTSADGATLE